MKYYLHDTSAFEDEKVTELYMQFGYEGVGLFYVILEKIAKQEKPVKTDVLKAQLRIGKRLEKCWKFMETLGIISSSNGETFNKQLLNFSESYQIKKEKNRKRIYEWREKQIDTENVTRNKSVRNATKVKESKVKESKVKSMETEIVFPFDSIAFQMLWEQWKEYKKAQHRFTYKCSKTEQAALKQLGDLAAGNEAVAMAIIEQSIANGWQGLFELKNQNTNGNKTYSGNNGQRNNRISDFDRARLASDLHSAVNKSTDR